MRFKVYDFTYDNKGSTSIGLKIVNFDGGGMDTDNIGVPLSIEESKIKRNPIPLFYGVEVTPKLTFKLQLAYIPDGLEGQNLITRQTMGAISKWLNKREYHELKIRDTDYTNIIYNCMFQNMKQIQIGNIPYGIEVDVICDRPYGFYRKSITKTINGNLNLFIQNVGFDNDYILPEVEFTNNSIGTTWSITNITDANKVTTFTGLSVNETVYVNSRTQQIISSTGLNRNPNFNFNWFRLTPNFDNSISITGNGTVTFRFEFPMPF